MHRWQVGLGATVLVSAMWVGQAAGGWVIDEVMKGAPDGARRQVALQANQMKTVLFESEGKPISAFTVDLNANTITMVDYASRSYATAPIAEYVQTMKAVQQSAGARMAQTMKQLESQLDNLPPEQRKAVEELMRSRAAQPPGGAPQECREARVEIRSTGQPATVAGYTAVRHEVVVDGKPHSLVWLARDLTAWRELDPEKLDRFAAEMSKLATCASGQSASGAADEAAWRVASQGYPVRHAIGTDTTMEVVKAERRAVPAAEFQPPAGFSRKTLKDMFGQ